MITVCNDEIKSAKNLKSKKAAWPKGTTLHQLLMAALAAEDMSIKDVQFIQTDIPSGTATLASGNIDVTSLANFVAYNAFSSGAGHSKNCASFVNSTIVIATTEKFVNEYPKATEILMELHQK